MSRDQLLHKIETPEYSGYLMKDIKNYLSPNNFERFTDWYKGQTGAIHEGELLVYTYDWDSFLGGGKVYD